MKKIIYPIILLILYVIVPFYFIQWFANDLGDLSYIPESFIWSIISFLIYVLLIYKYKNYITIHSLYQRYHT